jgi:N6-adenosine-specific RNA methylase IME4
MESLVSSMRTHGYDPSKPVLRYRGEILDGRNRLRAAELAGVTPTFDDVADDADPFLESWKHNGARRDLDAGQRVAIWKLVNIKSDAWKAEQDARRQAANAARTGRPRKATLEQGSAMPNAELWAADQERKGKLLSREEYARKHPSLAESPPSREGGLSHPNATSTATAIASRIGTSRATVERVTMVAGDDEAKLHDLATGRVKLADAVREHKREKLREKLDDVTAREAKAATGVYDVLVIDPPWPMKKIERDERPNQSEFDYPTMTEGELAQLDIPAAEDCHVWLWTTHKFLPMAVRLLGAWGLRYVCTFVWHKPGGFQPIGLPQYNCEFAIYARQGAPAFLDTKALPTCFDAPRGKHSEKPEAFYDVVRRVTGGRRLDMFNRRPIAGFDSWGKEAAE